MSFGKGQQGDVSFMPSRDLVAPTPQCKQCANWYAGTQTCAAFQKLIPVEIWANQFDHREPFPGDDGVRFEFSNRPSMEESQ